jgi:hypothetical protein
MMMFMLSHSQPESQTMQQPSITRGINRAVYHNGDVRIESKRLLIKNRATQHLTNSIAPNKQQLNRPSYITCAPVIKKK